jgi:hypothetical protein
MRLLLLLALTLIPAAARAADDAAGAEVHAVNTVCPVDGKKIDPKLAPVRVELDGDPARVVWVGVCSEEDRKKVQADPKRYAKAAVVNKKAPSDGK